MFVFALPRLKRLNGDTVLCFCHMFDLDALTNFYIFVTRIRPWLRVSLGKVATALFEL